MSVLQISLTSRSQPPNSLTGSGDPSRRTSIIYKNNSIHLYFQGQQSLLVDTSSGTRRHLPSLCSNTRFSVCQVAIVADTIVADTIATIATLFRAPRSGHTDCGRQVTDLNGASIFRIIQQSDGAAVFPLKIPDAATHESAQHLLRESPLCV